MKNLLSSLIAFSISLLYSTGARATTIAYDGESLAADSQITEGGTKYLNYLGMKKLCRIRGYIVGCAGDVADSKKFKAWFADQTKTRPSLTCMTALVLGKDGCFEYNNHCQKTRITAPYAIGSGKEAAIGAMMAGAKASKAVQIAGKIDLYTGGKIQMMTPTNEIFTVDDTQLDVGD